jgi:CMP-N,N'-diacetyllegionaminic acid synthase
MNIIGIIPARGGSTGIKLKNIKKINGKPLIEYTIKSALESKKIDRLIVSTDNEKIAKISKNLGAEVPFIRPKKFSQNTSSIKDVILHLQTHLVKTENYFPDIGIILQPTSPFRDVLDIDNSIKILAKKNTTSVISVAKVKNHPNNLFKNNNSQLFPLNKNFENFSIRQKLNPLFYPTGLIYTFYFNNLKKFDSIYGPKIKPLLINNKLKNIDIDESYELFLTQMIMQNWSKYKNFFH